MPTQDPIPLASQDIPIIDLSQSDDAVLAQLRYACTVVGFMQVVGHGVSEALLERHAELHRRFFELPDAVKRRLELSDASPVRGYFGRGGEDLDQVMDLKEGGAPKQRTRSLGGGRGLVTAGAWGIAVSPAGRASTAQNACPWQGL